MPPASSPPARRPSIALWVNKYSSIPIVDLVNDLQPRNIILRKQVPGVEIVAECDDIVRDLCVTRTEQLSVDIDQGLRILHLVVDLADQLLRCLQLLPQLRDLLSVLLLKKILLPQPPPLRDFQL